MKSKSFTAVIAFIGLMLLQVSSFAAAGERFQKFVGSEFSNFQGLYIIAGIVISSLVLYLVLNHFNKEEESSAGHSNSIHRRHRTHGHVHKVIKKTS